MRFQNAKKSYHNGTDMNWKVSLALHHQILEIFSTSCINNDVVSSIDVSWGSKFGLAYAKFEYANYNYYFSVDVVEQDYILQLVELLLN